MTCRDVSKKAVASYDTVQQMYVGLGLRRTANGLNLNATGELAQTGLSLKGLTADSLKCFDDLTANPGASKATSLQSNVADIRGLIDYLRTDGNTGEADTISGEEIDAYVTAYLDTSGGKALKMTAQEYRDLTVANLSAYVSLVDYSSGGAAAAPAVDAKADPISAAVGTYQTVQQMYVGLAGREDSGVRIAASEELPEGGLSVGPLTEANMDEFYDAIGWAKDQREPATPLQANAAEIVDLINYLTQAAPDGGDLDGNLASISSAEVDAYVRAYVDQERARGDRSITFDGYRAQTVGNLNAFIGAVQAIVNPPAASLPSASEPTTFGSRASAGTPVSQPEPPSSNPTPVTATSEPSEEANAESSGHTALWSGLAVLVFGLVVGPIAFALGRRGMAGVFKELKKEKSSVKSLTDEVERLNKLIDQKKNVTVEIRPRPRINAAEPPTMEQVVSSLLQASGGLVYDLRDAPSDFLPDVEVVERQIALLYPSTWMTPDGTQIRDESRVTLREWADWAVDTFNQGRSGPESIKALWENDIKSGLPVVPKGIPLSELKALVDYQNAHLAATNAQPGVTAAQPPSSEAEDSLRRAEGKPSFFESGWVELAKHVK